MQHVAHQGSDPAAQTSLVDRLRGIYRIPITDGLGPAGGDEPDNPDEFVRRFETPPIHQEAADEIERLREQLAAHQPEAQDRQQDPIVQAVRAELQARSERGIATYGTTLARTDLSHADWLRHLFEELLDAALYTRRLLEAAQDTTKRQALQVLIAHAARSVATAGAAGAEAAQVAEAIRAVYPDAYSMEATDVSLRALGLDP